MLIQRANHCVTNHKGNHKGVDKPLGEGDTGRDDGFGQNGLVDLSYVDELNSEYRPGLTISTCEPRR